MCGILFSWTGFFYISIASAVPIVLFMGKDSMCSQNPPPKECPHPSVSDVEHQSPDRGMIVAVIFVRSILGVLILVAQRAFFDEEEVTRKSNKWHSESEASAHGGDLQRVRQEAGVAVIVGASSNRRQANAGAREPTFQTQEQLQEYNRVHKQARI